MSLAREAGSEREWQHRAARLVAPGALAAAAAAGLALLKEFGMTVAALGRHRPMTRPA